MMRQMMMCLAGLFLLAACDAAQTGAGGSQGAAVPADEAGWTAPDGSDTGVAEELSACQSQANEMANDRDLGMGFMQRCMEAKGFTRV